MAPFVKGRLMCPSPMMNDGWVVQVEDGKILHVREAAQPNAEAEDLRRELEDQQAQVRALCALQAQERECGEEEQVLQTMTVPLSESGLNADVWRPSFQERGRGSQEI